MLFILISLAIAGLVCGMPHIARVAPLREGVDGSTTTITMNTGSNSGAAGQAVKAPPPQPAPGDAQQNAAAIRALRDQISGIAGLSQTVATLKQKIESNSVALVGKHGDGGIQKAVNQAQQKCDEQK